MQIIPALYIQDGKPAIFNPGDIEQIQYIPIDPYKLIEKLEKYDIQRISLFDVDAARDNGENNTGLIGSLSNTTIAELEVGGGLRNMDYLKSLQFAGVDFFILGSAVFEKEDFLLELSQAEHVNNDSIMIAVDLLNGQLTIHGWTQPMDDHQVRKVIQQCLDLGFKRFICTDVDTDKPEREPDIVFYEELVQQFPEAIFSAAGHINSFEDIRRLKSVGIQEVLVGNKIYSDDALLEQISLFNQEEMKAEKE